MADPLLSIDDLAKAAHLHRGRLWKLFRTGLGVSPKQFLKRLRIAQACMLLVTTNETVESIALRVGYRSTTRFYRAFREEKEVPPGRYRRQASARH